MYGLATASPYIGRAQCAALFGIVQIDTRSGYILETVLVALIAVVTSTRRASQRVLFKVVIVTEAFVESDDEIWLVICVRVGDFHEIDVKLDGVHTLVSRGYSCLRPTAVTPSIRIIHRGIGVVHDTDDAVIERIAAADIDSGDVASTTARSGIVGRRIVQLGDVQGAVDGSASGIAADPDVKGAARRARQLHHWVHAAVIIVTEPFTVRIIDNQRCIPVANEENAQMARRVSQKQLEIRRAGHVACTANGTG